MESSICILIFIFIRFMRWTLKLPIINGKMITSSKCIFILFGLNLIDMWVNWIIIMIQYTEWFFPTFLRWRRTNNINNINTSIMFAMWMFIIPVNPLVYFNRIVISIILRVQSIMSISRSLFYSLVSHYLYRLIPLFTNR